jgi:hypothetical protein
MEAVRNHPITTKSGHHRWLGRRYCELMGEDPLGFLRNAPKGDIMTGLKWMHDTYRTLRLIQDLQKYAT